MTRQTKHSFPVSFPNAREEQFIDLLLCDDSVFPLRFAAWKRDVVLDDVDYATLGLLPLLHKRLSSLGIDDPIGPRLAGVYKVAWVKNQLLLKEVREIAKACADADLPVVLLKGLALLLSVYRDAGARFLADGDILVRPEHVRAVIGILLKRGWKPLDTGLITGVDTFSFGSVVHAFSFSKNPELTIELHWHLFHIANTVPLWKLFTLRDMPRLAPADKWAFEGVARVDLERSDYKRLSFETMLVHIISHGADENTWRPFRWVVDAAWIIRTQNLDWDKVLDAGVAMDRVIDMKLGCEYLVTQSGVSMPPPFMAALDALPVTFRNRRDYRARTTKHFRLLGNFPALWYRYWKYEAPSSLANNIFGFPGYLAAAWGLAHISALPTFIFKKYRDRWRLVRRRRNPA